MTEEEYFRKHYPDFCYGDKPLSPHWDFFQDGVEFGERQSEKKIEELKNKIADIKANCDLAIEGRDIKIKELEQQIERAVDIIRDLGSTVREGVTCHYLVDNGGLHRATLFIKEIKEND